MSCDSTVDVDMGDVELPEVFTPTKKNKHEYKVDSIVWAKWRKEFWPALVRRCIVTKKKKRVMIVFVDSPCDESGNERRLNMDVKNIVRFDNNPKSVELMKNGLNSSDELRRAIETAKKYIVKRGMNGISGSPVQFFADPFIDPKPKKASVKRKLLDNDNGQNAKKAPVEVETKEQIDADDDDKETSETEKEEDAKKSSPPKSKLNQRLGELIMTTVKSDSCMKHLLRILNGKLKNKRHASFQATTKRSKSKELHVCCFGQIISEAQMHEIVDFYKPIVEKETSKPKSYVINYVVDVMAPEALGFALKALLKLPQSDIENILQCGKLPDSFQEKVDALA